MRKFPAFCASSQQYETYKHCLAQIKLGDSVAVSKPRYSDIGLNYRVIGIKENHSDGTLSGVMVPLLGAFDRCFGVDNYFWKYGAAPIETNCVELVSHYRDYSYFYWAYPEDLQITRIIKSSSYVKKAKQEIKKS